MSKKDILVATSAIVIAISSGVFFGEILLTKYNNIMTCDPVDSTPPQTKIENTI